ncbi:hypothetical protein FDG2_0129 [Candidatus Protofrankia californiensis]|uniref:Uncharacterized protein n=1 Tax=Candidatus Protofrankia californiensis TaxID=1839754 RepID=A0A1C3NSY1_9ACTN|nr:hypothetical protein FDG2_0129 [Candidatus Protofrankia californiensis]
MKPDIRAELRLLPLWAAAAVVLVAVVVLVLRITGLIVVAIVDAAERVDVAMSTTLGISPLGASTLLLPADWTPGGGWQR